METIEQPWFSRHQKSVVIGVLTLLLLIIAIETFVIVQQRQMTQRIEAESAKMLNKFLSDEQSKSSGRGVPIRLQNIRFKWSDKIFIDTGNMAVKAVPVKGDTVNFDYMNSFFLNVQKSDVLIRPSVLEGMFNESVFNYPGSKLRDLKVSITQATVKDSKEERYVKLNGSVDFILWIPFEMLTKLLVDKSTNTLVIDVQDLKIFGIFPANQLIKWKPFKLEKMVSLPPNNHLSVSGNRMYVKPFGLFPPPRINGQIDSIVVGDNMIRLSFAGSAIQAPELAGHNYVYLRGGNARFGQFAMMDTNILVRDKTPNDPFVFSLEHYASMVPKSQMKLKKLDAIELAMPDFAKE